MESQRCFFAMFACVDSKSGVTCCWWQKNNCAEGHCNMEPLGCGLCGWVDVFGFKKVWHLCGVANVAQQIEMEDQHWRPGIVNHLIFSDNGN